MNEENIKDLEMKLMNKTEELKNMKAQVIKQDKMASIGYLAAGIAHEINNPLGFISSNFESLNKYIDILKINLNKYFYLESIINKSNNDDIKKTVDEIIKFKNEKDVEFICEDINNLIDECSDGLERILSIVKGLRLFFHEAVEEKFNEYDINNGIKNTLIIAKNEVKYYANIILKLGDIPVIEAIGGHVNQVLLNIIINAVHAIREKGEGKLGNIVIRTYNDEQYIYCTIEDDGIGISKENLKKIFEPFFTTKSKGRGTGLGLSISFDLIKQQHNGEIFVDSEEGKGTKFTIKLPIKHVQKEGN